MKINIKMEGINMKLLKIKKRKKSVQIIDPITKAKYIESYNKIDDTYYYLNPYTEMEHWARYNENGDVIWYKDSRGFEYTNEYDDSGHLICHKNSNGRICHFEYDETGYTSFQILSFNL